MQHHFFTTFLAAVTTLALATACNNAPEAPVPVSTRPAAPFHNTADATVAATAATGEVRLNPAHGEPGHVCEIPVGAPLDGSASTNASAPMEITTPPAPAFGTTLPMGGQSSPAITLPSGTPNPPHGEPGHKCEVNVGDPLP